jgi:hypothetical protein
VAELARLTRLQLAAGGLLLALAAAGLAGTLFSPATVFLLDADGAAWIQAPFPVRRTPFLIESSAVPEAGFARRFELSRVAPDAALELSAWREVEVCLNGVPLPLAPAALDGGALRVPVAAQLRTGENQIEVVVRNPSGPPLLRARITGVEPVLATGAGWTARVGEREEAPALVADDTRMPGELLRLPTPLAGLRARALPLVAAFALGAAAFALLRRRLPADASPRALRALGAAAALLWLALFLANAPRVPLAVGPDALRHVEYARWVHEHAALPRADQGWAMYHPPLFYALSAGVLALLDPAQDGRAERVALRLLPALATLGCVLLAGALARVACPARPRLALFAALFAALLPMNLVLATYVSNESLHGFLAGAALLAGARLLRAPRAGARAAARVGGLFGLAVLAKVTSLLLVPLAATALALRALAVDRASLARAAALAGTLVAAAALVSGGFFVRNQLQFGQPLVWNQSLPGQAFWQEPGFRTPRYYLGFGAALRHPYAASFHSLGDALYVTGFGDGNTGGVTDPAVWAAFWDAPAASATFALALPWLLLLPLGAARLARGALVGGDPGRRLVFTLSAAALFVLTVALAQRSLAEPYYSFVKASFALCVLGPLSLAAALGLDAAHRGLSRLGALAPAVLYGWLAALATATVLGLS